MTVIDVMVLETILNQFLKNANATQAARALYSNAHGNELSENPSFRLNNYLKRTLGIMFAEIKALR